MFQGLSCTINLLLCVCRPAPSARLHRLPPENVWIRAFHIVLILKLACMRSKPSTSVQSEHIIHQKRHFLKLLTCLVCVKTVFDNSGCSYQHTKFLQPQDSTSSDCLSMKPNSTKCLTWSWRRNALSVCHLVFVSGLTDCFISPFAAALDCRVCMKVLFKCWLMLSLAPGWCAAMWSCLHWQ